MNTKFQNKSIESLLFQRNIFIALTGIISLTLLLSMVLLFWKNEKIIVVPPTIEKTFWVDAHSVSPTYLEQFGYFLGQLVLSKSSQSALSQREVLLKHTDPSYAGLLNKKLIKEEEMLSKQNASYVFFPTSVQVQPDSLEVLLSGERTLYVSGSPLSKKKEQYVLNFVNCGSRILLKGISSYEEAK